MKRLFLLAATAVVLATSCEKHEIRNEVINEIGFNSNLDKMTKAITTGTTYNTAQPFAVLAYSHQDDKTTLVMDGAEISYQTDAWKATTGKYYWPNDATTTMNFYAYSPAISTDESRAGHMKMNGTLVNGRTTTGEGENAVHTDTDKGGININGYQHTNMYVDFMVADAATGKTFDNCSGVVPVVFRHKMAQVKFNVKLTSAISGVEFTLEQITLNAINNAGKVVDGVLSVDGSTTATYTIFPATADCPNGAETATTITTDGVNTQPVTMIPQTMTDKQFTVKYSIKGNGVASETVTKTIDLSTAAWEANKTYIYNLTIGMNEITFQPSVILWDDANSNGTVEDSEKTAPVTIPVL